MAKLKSKKVILILLGLVVLGVVLWWGLQRFNNTPSRTIADGQVVTAELAGRTIEVEVVKTPASIGQGLSDRLEIGSDGMLFLLGRDQFPRFWMLRMQFDLDLVWMRDGTIVDITRDVPRPDPQTPESELPLYSPKVAVNQVLEIPAGTAAEWGLAVGDQLEIK